MEQICPHCRIRMDTVRKSPHPTLWPDKVLAIYECPRCLRSRECIEDGRVRRYRILIPRRRASPAMTSQAA
jgi:hypothetical protein